MRKQNCLIVALVAGLGTLLAGCASKDGTFSTLTGESGACTSFDAPRYQVLGKTAYDQQWVDGQTEAGIAGCAWKRPEPRPPEMDTKPVAKTPAMPASPPKKRRFWQRMTS